MNATLELNVAGSHTVIVLSNFDPPTAGRVARKITGMLRSQSTGEADGDRYRIGVGLAPNEEGVTVSFVVEGGPAEKGGVKADDVILALNGIPITDDPIAQFDAVLAKPDPIKLKIRRGATLKILTITPERGSP